MRKEVNIAYVAFCVTLTCTAATMTTFTFHTDAPRYSIAQVPEAIEVPFTPETPTARHRFLVSRLRFGRHYNKLAIGGLSV